MKNAAKKIMIYSMVGMMQIGLGATVVAASPLYDDGPQRIIQLDDGGRWHHDRQWEHDRRVREENRRHEWEMRRRDHEREREWHERQERENRRHDNTMNEIAAGIIGIVIGTQLQ